MHTLKQNKICTSTSIIEEKPPSRDVLDTWFGGLILVLTVFIHFFCALYLILISTFQYMHTALEAEVLGIIDPIVTVITHYVCAALHLKGLFSTICCRTRKTRKEKKGSIRVVSFKRSKTERKNVYSLMNISKDIVDVCLRLFDINGKYFELGIIFLEAFEVLAATSQAYLMSKNSPRRIPPFLFSLLVSLNCIVTPSLMQSRKRSTRRYLILLVDGLFDFLYSVSFPVYIIVTKSYDNYANANAKSLYNDPYYVTESVFDTRQAFITSRISLFVNLAPFVLTYVTFQTLTNIVKKNRQWNQETSNFQASKKQMQKDSYAWLSRLSQIVSKRRRIIQFCFIGWSILVFVLSFVAINREKCHEACVHQCYPWFHRKCSCIAFNINCKKFKLTTDEMYKEVSLISSNLYILEIAQCDLSNGPKMGYVERFNDLVWFRLMFNRIDRWQDTQNFLPKRLNFFHMDGSNLTQVPIILRINVPPALRIIYLKNSLISDLPIDTHLYWKSLYNIGIGHARLSKFPSQILKLPLLSKISFPSNLISDVPRSLSSSSILLLDLRSNKISTLPANLLENLPNLRELLFDANPIRHLPDAFDKYFYNLNIFGLSETDLCKRLSIPGRNSTNSSLEVKIANNLKITCPKLCSSHCSPYYVGDNFCELECNMHNCNWDGGDCSNYAF